MESDVNIILDAYLYVNLFNDITVDISVDAGSKLIHDLERFHFGARLLFFRERHAEKSGKIAIKCVFLSVPKDNFTTRSPPPCSLYKEVCKKN